MPLVKNYTGVELLQMRDRLSQDRDVYIGLREACRFYFNPQQLESRVFGNKVSEKLTPQNSMGVQSARDLTSGLYSNTINLSDEFFGFTVANKELSENDNVKDWFAKCSEIAVGKLASTNYSHSTLQTLRDYVVVCTGVQYSEMDTESKKLRFTTFMVDHCSIAENEQRKIDTIFRDFEMTAQQAYEKWGDECPESVKEKYKDVNKRFDKDRYVHCVFPRLDYEERKRQRKEANIKIERGVDMAYASYYVHEETKEIVVEGGYRTCPYAVPRFERADETPYGRGTAFTARGIMAQLEQLCYSISDGVELGVNPPIVKPPHSSDMWVDDITPGGTIYADPNGPMPTFYQSNIDVNSGAQYKMLLEQEVKNLFYVDLFKMLEDRKNMTATEVAQRVAEKTQLLLPVISNIYDELYSVQLKRVFYLLLDNGFFPVMPAELAQVWEQEELRISYSTKLDLKLAQLEIGQILKSINEINLIYAAKQENPDIVASLKVDEVSKEILRMNNVSPDYIQSDDATEQYYEDKAAAEQQAMNAEMASKMMQPLNLQETIEQNSPLQMGLEGAGMTGIGGY